MSPKSQLPESLLEHFLSTLDIPRSYYERALDRARSLEEWLRRPDSLVARLKPDVFPQGSFRYGTAIRPLLEGDFYDLDLVCSVSSTKTDASQKEVKDLIGHEIKAYAAAHGFKDPVEEKPRCWRLNYADQVSFHIDLLPCVPEDRKAIELLIEHMVPPSLASEAIAITDRRHPSYDVIDPRWFSSNPRGFAKWFEARAKLGAEARLRRLVANRVYASVDEIPPYEWKSPLQSSIQLLKRHRDVMFRKDRDLAPISMIVTTLAAHAYRGEGDVMSTLAAIVPTMGGFVRNSKPWVPNPANPADDFAHRWETDRRLRDNFELWLKQVGADLNKIGHLTTYSHAQSFARGAFDLEVSREKLEQMDSGKRLGADPSIVFKASPVPAVSFSSGPKPWRR